MRNKKLSRRTLLKTTVASGAALFTGFPYIKSASSAGKLTVGTVDHWVPGNNDILREICKQWGDDNGVEVTVDFITVIGNKLLLTAQAEARAKIGHDVYAMTGWMSPMFRHRLEPLNDVVADIIEEHGPLAEYAKYAAHLDDVWLGSPAPTSSLNFAALSRLDLFKQYADIDLQKYFVEMDNEK